jgi:hypothetical protein
MNDGQVNICTFFNDADNSLVSVLCSGKMSEWLIGKDVEGPFIMH